MTTHQSAINSHISQPTSATLSGSMDNSKPVKTEPNNAEDSSSQAITKPVQANSQNAPAATPPMFAFPQQGPYAFGPAGGFACFPPQVPGQPVMNPFFNGFMPGAQPMMGNPAFYFQGALQGGAGLMPQNAPGPGSASVTLPAAAMAAFGPRGIPQFFNQSQMNPPSSQEVQDALAKITAASNTTALAGAPGAQPVAEQQTSSSTKLGDGKGPVLVFMECDEESLSDYQCLLRKQIELFEASSDDVQWNAQGRNKAIVMGQVGIRCRYCARLPTWSRARGAVYYSATLDGLYQAAQNMAKNHLCRHCRLIPEDVRQKLMGLRDCKRRAAGGKKYWAEGARVLGVEQCNDGLRFKASTTGRIKKQNQEPSS